MTTLEILYLVAGGLAGWIGRWLWDKWRFYRLDRQIKKYRLENPPIRAGRGKRARE